MNIQSDTDKADPSPNRLSFALIQTSLTSLWRSSWDNGSYRKPRPN